MRPLLWTIMVATTIAGFLSPMANAETNRPVRITEVYLAPPGSFVGFQKLELTNIGTEPVDIGGWCLRSSDLDREFPLGTVLLPGAVLTIHVGAWGHNNNANFYTGDDFPSLRRFWGSIEIHQAGTDFNDPDLLADYVSWGGPYHANVDLAQEAGIWESGDFLPALTDEGHSFQYCDRTGSSAGAWSTDPSNIGSVNQCLLTPTPVEILTWGKVKSRYSN